MDIILMHVIQPYKSRKPAAHRLAKELINKSATYMEPNIQKFFNAALMKGLETDSGESRSFCRLLLSKFFGVRNRFCYVQARRLPGFQLARDAGRGVKGAKFKAFLFKVKDSSGQIDAFLTYKTGAFLQRLLLYFFSGSMTRFPS